jgi:transcriptional antiterminator NusG
MESEQHEFYVIRTALGKEDKFMDALAKALSRKEEHGIYAVFRPEAVKGYVFAEVESQTKLVDSVRGIPNNKGVIRTPVSFTDLEKYFEKGAEQIIVSERDIVEIIAGPFKGDRAKVVRVVPGKEEVIVEPVNMAVPIPITMGVDDIRVLEQSAIEENKDE